MFQTSNEGEKKQNKKYMTHLAFTALENEWENAQHDSLKLYQH